MPNRPHGRRPADSSPDFEGIDDDLSSEAPPWPQARGDSSADGHVVLSARDSGSLSGHHDEVLPTDSHVLIGTSDDSSVSNSSEAPILRSLHPAEQSAELSSSLHLQLTNTSGEATPGQRHLRTDTPRAAPTQPGRQGSRLTMILLASYASAVTLACLYLLMSAMQSKSRELESLPDVEPLDANEFRYVPENASLPQGHTLRLGRSQRFGNILVEPLRVTKEPLAFVHFSGDKKQQRQSTPPVLKLWVRFTNVSDDQSIAPLDRMLLFKRDIDDDSGQLLTNPWIRPLPATATDGAALCTFDHPLSSEWDIVAQHLGRRLKPGESFETFLPSQPDGLSQLNGESLWRMHIRKGYHAPTGHGVTTLVDVLFDAQQIEEPPSAPSST